MNKLDKETSEIIRNEKHVEELLKHDGWSIVENSLKNKIQDLQSILNVSGETPEQMVIDLKARAIAISILMDWLREIRGMSQNSQETKIEIKRESLIMRRN